jgi:hypothetical protein
MIPALDAMTAFLCSLVKRIEPAKGELIEKWPRSNANSDSRLKWFVCLG